MDTRLQIENAKYQLDDEGNNSVINCTIAGQRYSVPMNSDNPYYAEIVEQIADGILTIADAD